MGYREEFDNLQDKNPYRANALLWLWLQSDEHRPKLIKEYQNPKPKKGSKKPKHRYLDFISRAEETEHRPDQAPLVSYGSRVRVLFDPADIKWALDNLSSDPYKALGSGTAVLSSDNNAIDKHELKREALHKALAHPHVTRFMSLIINLSCHHALVAPRKTDKFDFVTDIAEQAALRFVEGLFGIPHLDHYLLQESLRKTYNAMAYQMLARHFVTEPLALLQGNGGMAKLAQLVGEQLEKATVTPFTPELSELVTEAGGKDTLTNLKKIKKKLEIYMARKFDKEADEKSATTSGFQYFLGVSPALEAMTKEKDSDKRSKVVKDYIGISNKLALTGVAGLIEELRKAVNNRARATAVSKRMKESKKDKETRLKEFNLKIGTILANIGLIEERVFHLRQRSGDLEKCSQMDANTMLAYISEALNFKVIREWFRDNASVRLLGLPNDSDEAREASEKLIQIIDRICTNKEERDDNLIPQKLNLLGDGNYIIRKTVIELVAEKCGKELTGAEMVVDIVAAIAGTVGNITAGAAITMDTLFKKKKDKDLIEKLRTTLTNGVLRFRLPDPEKKESEDIELFRTENAKRIHILRNHVKESLRLCPPPPFLPRSVPRDWVNWKKEYKKENPKKEIPGFLDDMKEEDQVLIPLAALTRADSVAGEGKPDFYYPERERNKRDNPENIGPEGNTMEVASTYTTGDYSYIFGWDMERDPVPQDRKNPTKLSSAKSHKCLGDHLSIPLIANIVGNTLLLQNIELDEPENVEEPGTTTEILEPGVTKKWGFICESLPMKYKREREVAQSPLNLIMKVRTPVAKHGEALKIIIKYGAPTIEYLLNNSDMVHFARFVLINNDTELALFTTYDDRTDDYLEHFAERAGPLFDKIFEHIQDPPKMPVRENPSSFVEKIKQYDRRPVVDYFYSAHPGRRVNEAADTGND